MIILHFDHTPFSIYFNMYPLIKDPRSTKHCTCGFGAEVFIECAFQTLWVLNQIDESNRCCFGAEVFIECAFQTLWVLNQIDAERCMIIHFDHTPFSIYFNMYPLIKDPRSTKHCTCGFGAEVFIECAFQTLWVLNQWVHGKLNALHLISEIL